jgi:hypothetical protein
VSHVRIGRGLWARLRVAALRAQTRTSAELSLPHGLEVGDSSAPLTPVHCIVFSKDRAMQLDACLRSIERSAPYAGPITVIYLATTEEFADGYRLLDLGERVRLVEQSDDFRSVVINALDPKDEHTVFHTDDDVFFLRPPTAPVLPPGFAAFSLRLGENTTYCYPLHRMQQVPTTAANGSVMAWDWTRAEGDFSYPMSLDGHILSTGLLLRMLARARFANPNQLEGELHLRRYLAPPAMLAFRESCLVSIPANIVSSTHQNPSGANPAWSAEALNRRFLAGERLDLKAMDFSAIQGAHQDVLLAFTRIRPKE